MTGWHAAADALRHAPQQPPAGPAWPIGIVGTAASMNEAQLNEPQPEPDRTDEVDRDDERRRQRGLEPLDPDAPGTWIVDPDGDAPEPAEPS